MDVLNINDKMFTCSCAMSSAPCLLNIIEPNVKVSENLNSMLTDKCSLTGSFISCCNVPTSAGSPGGPCAMALTVWEDTSDKITVDGCNVLTNKSQIRCALGGIIKPVILTPRQKNRDKQYYST